MVRGVDTLSESSQRIPWVSPSQPGCLCGKLQLAPSHVAKEQRRLPNDLHVHFHFYQHAPGVWRVPCGRERGWQGEPVRPGQGSDTLPELTFIPTWVGCTHTTRLPRSCLQAPLPSSPCTPCSMGMSPMAECTCRSSVACERPNEYACTSTCPPPIPTCTQPTAGRRGCLHIPCGVLQQRRLPCDVDQHDGYQLRPDLCSVGC
jgi:hypothetical protein